MRIIQKAVIKKEDKFLILLRPPNAKVYPNHWDFAGGKLEEGEEPKEGIEREVFEETTLKVKALDVIGTYDIVVNGIPRKFFIYSTEIISGDVKICHEHIDFKWATKEEIEKIEIKEPFMKIYFKENP